MEDLKWSSDLESGVHWIDTQHKNLMKRAEKLNRAIELGRSGLEVMKMMDFLENYVREHFRMEEELMREREYPDLDFHREDHQRFIFAFVELKRAIKNSNNGIEIEKDLQYELWKYFKEHVSVVDAAMSRYLKKKQKD